MSDKKPFRVMNEQARDDSICMGNCDECIKHGNDCHAGCGSIKEYAADLLDARKFIKEMRDTFTIIHQKSIAFVCEDMRALARIQLEKTKDY